MRCLEIGGGPSPAHPDWEQLDLNDWAARGNPTTHLYDMRAVPLPDGTFSEIYACNVLEHVRETHETLKEWTRLLTPGGRLTVIVPDLLGLYHDLLVGKNTWAEFSERVYGSQSYDEDVHRVGFTLSELEPIVRRVGLQVTELRPSHQGGGVYMEATKDA